MSREQYIEVVLHRICTMFDLAFIVVSREQSTEAVLPADADGGSQSIPDDGRCSSASHPFPGPSGALRKVRVIDL